MSDGPPTHRAAFHVACTGCGRALQDGFHPFCPECGAISDVTYELSAVELRDSANPYYRFFDLLPVAEASRLPRDAQFTPTVHAEALGSELGLPFLYLKDETGLPTGTTKDRMAAVALAYLYERGVRVFTTSSTGNSSSAYAYAIRHLPDLRMYVFTAADFRDRLVLYGSPQVEDVVLEDASFVEAFEVAGRFATLLGATSERGFFNPGRREGLKLAWLEAAEQIPQPIDVYVQAISSAMGVYGVFKAARERLGLGLSDRLPQLLLVQQDTCAPMVTAWRDGSDVIRPSDVVRRPTGIAAAILRGDPTRAYPHILRILRESGGAFTSVSENEIRAARDLIERLEGIQPCYAAAAAVAGLIQRARAGLVDPGQTVLINLTGGVREGEPPGAATHRLPRTADGWDLAGLAAPYALDRR